MTAEGERISRLHEDWRSRRRPKQIRTWCRKCGGHVIIDLGQLGYQSALNKMRQIDTTPMEHEGFFHTELGGWGILWRFDDVLELAYPKEYYADISAPHWPRPGGYPFHETSEAKAVEFVAHGSSLEETNHRHEIDSAINSEPRDRLDLQIEYGTVWDTEELRHEFEVVAFRRPFAIVKRHHDQCLGTVMFQCTPRFYFDFRPDSERTV